MSFLKKPTGRKIWTTKTFPKTEIVTARKYYKIKKYTKMTISSCEIELECGHWIDGEEWDSNPKRKRITCYDCIYPPKKEK